TTWRFGGGRDWSYDDTFGLVQTGRTWRVHWTPAVLQPKLRAGQRLVLITSATDQPAVVDRDGKPLVVTGSGGPRMVDPQPFPLLRTALIGQVPSSPSDVFAVERVDTAGNNLETLFGTTGGQTTTRKSTLSST